MSYTPLQREETGNEQKGSRQKQFICHGSTSPTSLKVENMLLLRKRRIWWRNQKEKKNSGEGSSQWRICKDASFDGRETEDGKNILIFQRHAGAIIESCLRILHEYGASYSEGYIL